MAKLAARAVACLAAGVWQGLPAAVHAQGLSDRIASYDAQDVDDAALADLIGIAIDAELAHDGGAEGLSFLQATARLHHLASAGPAAPAAPAAPARPRAPRPREEDNGPILSYSCTCAAVAEVFRISEKKAAELADSSAEFSEHLTDEQWERVKERSVAIEKERKEQQRQKEKNKQAAALARISGSDGMVAAPPPQAAAAPAAAKAASRAPPGAVAAKAPPQGVPKSKAKAAASVPGKAGGLKGLANGNRFGGLDGNDSSGEEDDGWTSVRR